MHWAYFKRRNKIGIDVAVEALRNSMKTRSRRALDQIYRYARFTETPDALNLPGVSAATSLALGNVFNNQEASLKAAWIMQAPRAGDEVPGEEAAAFIQRLRRREARIWKRPGCKPDLQTF